MIKIFCYFSAFLLLSLGYQGKLQASTTAGPTSNDKHNAEVEQAGLSFYKWYFKAVDSKGIPFDAGITEDEKGMCKLDPEPYFNELRKLGTISEKFIESERRRNSACEEYVKKVHYKVYESGDAYTFNGMCPQFAYMYWTASQDTYQKVKATRTDVANDGLSASVDVLFIYTEGPDGPVIPKTPNARVFLEREQGKWKIVKIVLLDENGLISQQEEDTDIVEESPILGSSWSNNTVSLNISEKRIAFTYHGQCVYFYPVQVINNKEVILIWANDMDCKFDNGTNQTFGLKKYPQSGKPFARYTVEAGVLYTEYFYKEWVEKYRQEVNSETFTDLYFFNPDDL